MPYVLNDEVFDTKSAVVERCRAIIARSVDGRPVDEADADFLFDLFRYHDEWEEKAAGVFLDFSTQMTIHGTRCFVIRKQNDQDIDISYYHAVRQLPNARSGSLLPQKLRDFRNAARTAIQSQINEYRTTALQFATTCPVTGELITRGNSAVDHIAPDTFDALLFRFCTNNAINPIQVAVGSHQGVVATLIDSTLKDAWSSFHREHAKMRLLSRKGNLSLSKTSMPWHLLGEE